MEDFDKALKYAFLLLKFRQRSSSELTFRLKKKGYSDQTIQKILEYLKGNKYLDDLELAKNYIMTLSKKGFGKKRILSTLKKLGILEQVLENLNFKSDIEMLSSMIDKKILQYKGSKNISGKILRYFLARGFEYEEILDQLNKKGLYNDNN
ncbi:MAG: RecX family transcriptional regulator [Candidatus Omnitrophica bacterium]|nr:RecX family transcriptional regulator [Candidatus Omnitrophota bacterium]